MPVLIVIDHAEGHIKKTAYEVLCYGAAIAASLHTQAAAFIAGRVEGQLSELGKIWCAKCISGKHCHT